MANYCVQVAEAIPGKDGKLSVGPVYRNSLAKDGFPPLDPDFTTSWDVFRRGADNFPNNPMLGWREIKNGKAGPYVWKTYKEAFEQVLHLGSALSKLGVGPGSRIGIYGANCPQWVEAMEACNGYSLICVPLYDTLGAGAVDYIIEHAEIENVFVQDKKISKILSNCNSAKQQLKTIISFTSTTKEQVDAAAELGVKLYSYDEFVEMGKKYPVEPVPPRPLDICTIMYTSGTSGTPKGVILTHESHAAIIAGTMLYMKQFEHLDKMTPADRYLSFLPLAHILDRMIEEYFFQGGASVGYFQGDIQLLVDDLNELKPTFFAGVPRVFERVHDGVLKVVGELLPHRRMIFHALYKFKLSWMNRGYPHTSASRLADFLAFRKVRARLGGRVRLIVSGGAPLSPEIEEFLRVTSCAYMTQGYGLTETCGLCTAGYPDDMSLVGTVGVASTYTEICLKEVPEMGYDPLGTPSRGEVCVRGKTLFSGYYKNPELTKEVMIDGWFHTGDIGEMSPEGVLKIIDRKKHIFKLSQGEYVAVEYLEKVYAVTPIVEDIWVYGDSFKSTLVAVVVPHERNTKRWAESYGYKGSFNDLCELKELKEYILQELNVSAAKNKLRGFEYIKGIALDAEPFDVERDQVTPTMKKKRAPLLKYYQSQIDEIYGSLQNGEHKNGKPM